MKDPVTTCVIWEKSGLQGSETPVRKGDTLSLCAFFPCPPLTTLLLFLGSVTLKAFCFPHSMTAVRIKSEHGKHIHSAGRILQIKSQPPIRWCCKGWEQQRTTAEGSAFSEQIPLQRHTSSRPLEDAEFHFKSYGRPKRD